MAARWVAVSAALNIVAAAGWAKADDWKTIDCSTSPLSVEQAPANRSCRRGPDVPSLRNGCYTNQFEVVWQDGDGLSLVYLEHVTVGQCYLRELDASRLTKLVTTANGGLASSLGEPTRFLEGYVAEFRRGSN